MSTAGGAASRAPHTELATKQAGARDHKLGTWQHRSVWSFAECRTCGACVFVDYRANVDYLLHHKGTGGVSIFGEAVEKDCERGE